MSTEIAKTRKGVTSHASEDAVRDSLNRFAKANIKLAEFQKKNPVPIAADETKNISEVKVAIASVLTLALPAVTAFSIYPNPTPGPENFVENIPFFSLLFGGFVSAFVPLIWGDKVRNLVRRKWYVRKKLEFQLAEKNRQSVLKKHENKLIKTREKLSSDLKIIRENLPTKEVFHRCDFGDSLLGIGKWINSKKKLWSLEPLVTK